MAFGHFVPAARGATPLRAAELYVRRHQMFRYAGVAVGVIATLVLLPFIVATLALETLTKCSLFIGWQLTHGARGIRALAVYSESPKWAEHFRASVLPLLADRTLSVNVTYEPRWRESSSLARRVHRRWGGTRNHTPIVIVFPRRMGRVRIFRFHEAYLRHSHNGDTSVLGPLVADLRAAANDA